jgi:hypothetical protein
MFALWVQILSIEFIGSSHRLSISEGKRTWLIAAPVFAAFLGMNYS